MTSEAQNTRDSPSSQRTNIDIVDSNLNISEQCTKNETSKNNQCQAFIKMANQVEGHSGLPNPSGESNNQKLKRKISDDADTKRDGYQKRSIDVSDNDESETPSPRSLKRSDVDSDKLYRTSAFARISSPSASNEISLSKNKTSRSRLHDEDQTSKRSRSCSEHSQEVNPHRQLQKRIHSQGPCQKQPVLYCYGDSFIGTLTLFDERKVRVTKFKGASAKGLNNPISALRIGNKLLDLLDSKKPKNILMFFGNVDFHLNFIYQMQTKGNAALRCEEFRENVFHEYTSFIENKILNRLLTRKNDRYDGYLEKILVCSVIMPVVENEFINTSIASYTASEKVTNVPLAEKTVSVDELLRQKRGCDIESRRDMVMEFNKRVQTWCANLKKQKYNVIYIDINKYIIDKSTNIVKKEFRDLNPVNIHILWEPTIPFWLEEIKKSGLPFSEKDIKVDLERSLGIYLEDKKHQMKEIAEARAKTNKN